MSEGYTVELTCHAESDLLGIYQFVVQHDSLKSAEWLFDKLTCACEKLSNFPGKGRTIPELKSLPLRDHLESFLGPYRIIYTIQRKVCLYPWDIRGEKKFAGTALSSSSSPIIG